MTGTPLPLEDYALLDDALCAERIRAAKAALGDRCVILGRGFDYASAREWALKLKELAQVAADPYSAADFEHGPLAGFFLDDPCDAIKIFAAFASGHLSPDFFVSAPRGFDC